MKQGSDKGRACSCLGGCEVTDHSDDLGNGKEDMDEGRVAAIEAVSGCEGLGDTKGAGVALGLRVRAICRNSESGRHVGRIIKGQAAHNASEVSGEQRG